MSSFAWGKRMEEKETKIGIASACRRELAEQNVKANCCRRALLGGMMINAAVEGESITFTLDEAEAADAALRLLRQCWSAQAEATPLRRGAHKAWQIAVTSRKAADWLNRVRASGALAGGCVSCAAHFAQGMFIAGGTLTSPEKDLHLEFLIRVPESVPAAEAALAAIGAEPKSAVRPRGTGLYFKRSETIEDLLAALGATKTVFEFINAKIVREIRNHENRVSNCDTGNIQKSVSATRKQLDAIDELTRCGRLDRLDDELRRTAELRAANPELSLAELGQRMSPPISKSGMYHRMNKIMEVAEAVRAEAERKE